MNTQNLLLILLVVAVVFGLGVVVLNRRSSGSVTAFLGGRVAPGARSGKPIPYEFMRPCSLDFSPCNRLARPLMQQ